MPDGPRKDIPPNEIGGGTPGEPSKAFAGIVENVENRIANLQAQGKAVEAQALSVRLAKAQETYAATGRIGTSPLPDSPRLQNVAQAAQGTFG